MKIFVVICALSTISIAAAKPSPTTAAELTTSSNRGRQITLYYSNSTAYIQLVCTCTNELILWLANGSVCKAFLNRVFLEQRSALCENCTSQFLLLTPPFVAGRYLCIGSGIENACVKRWALLPQPQPTVRPRPTSPPTLNFLRAAASVNRLWLPYLGLTLFFNTKKMQTLVLLLGLLSFVFGENINRPVQIFVKSGANVTLQANTSNANEVTWYVEENYIYDNFHTMPPFFAGIKLCHFKSDGTNITFNFGSPFNFNCANKSLNLYNLEPKDSATFNVKVTRQNLEYNTYFQLHVIYIPKPQCMVTSFYIAPDYCYIQINCTNSKYPNKVLFNGVARAYYNFARGGKTQLPEQFFTLVTYQGLTANFTYDYPFNSLCQTSGRAPHSAPRFVPRYAGPQPARLLGVQYPTPFYEENPDKDSDDAYEKAMAVVVIAAVVCSLVILAALLFLCYWRRRLRQRRQRGPQLMMTNQL
ncbi:E3 CR1 alpha-beta [Simian adenovirus A1139]|uniref:E3 CR1 alpha-beta n=1 Tax=Simian adenovirus A1139 TaxID=1159186 RepID=H9AA95_9ADEN|nr:E3 CR1 alpha-beta [Simian adenovirus A1139]